VTVVRVRPVSTCVAVTVAPGTTEPLESETAPKIVPVVVWGYTGSGPRYSNTRQTGIEWAKPTAMSRILSMARAPFLFSDLLRLDYDL
ncbi:MAG: hypothetical protein DMG09_14755, partial [Acidobacteria bacterium]